jgi:hypothetical protein
VVTFPLVITGCSKDDDRDNLNYSLIGTTWICMEFSEAYSIEESTLSFINRRECKIGYEEYYYDNLQKEFHLLGTMVMNC